MAELPLVREQRVDPSGTVAPYQNVGFEAEAFGAGIGRALSQLGQSGQDLARTEAQLRSERKANDALTSLTEAKDELRGWMFDDKDGILAKTGGNASGSGAQAQVVVDDIRRRYLDKIEDPETRDAWSKMWDREAETAKDQASRHELSQLTEYKAQTTKGLLLSNMQDAYNSYNDDEAIKKAVATTRAAIRANSLGLPAEMVSASESEAVSSIHLAVVSRWAVEDPRRALEYYETHKDEFSGKDHATVTQFLQPALDERKANEFVAGQLGQGGKNVYNLAEAVEFAESNGNPNAQSGADAHGVMQLIPGTARDMARKLGMTEIANLSDDELRAKLKGPENVALNRALGRAYLKEQLERYDGDIEAALVGYNAGPVAADAFLKHNAGRRPGQRDYSVPGWKGIKNESEAYVRRVLGKLAGNSGKVPDNIIPAPPTANPSEPAEVPSEGMNFPGSFYAGLDSPAIAAWKEAAQGIVDAGVRSRVLAKLEIESARQESAGKLADAANKTAAWEVVVAGSTKDLTPQQMMKLEPSFINSLYAYEANRDRPGGIKHDDFAWAQVNQLAPEDLAAMNTADVYQFRPKLDNEHFDKLVALQRAAAEAQRGNAAANKTMAGQRNRSDIMRDTQLLMGWDTRNPGSADSKKVAQLNRALDSRIILEGTAKGRDLTSVEVQDIVDKLLIQDQSAWFSGDYAMEAKTPETFIAAETWDTVAPDDQATLVQTYQNYNGGVAPDKETATDLYNRAMQVYLGAPATGPKDEQAAVRKQIETYFGRPFTDAEFNVAYGKWLLTFLGR